MIQCDTCGYYFFTLEGIRSHICCGSPALSKGRATMLRNGFSMKVIEKLFLIQQDLKVQTCDTFLLEGGE